MLTDNELKGTLLDHLAEQNQPLLNRLRQTKELPTFLSTQIREAKSVLEWNLRGLTTPDSAQLVQARDLAIQRLLEYPGSPTELVDPTTIDPFDGMAQRETFGWPAEATL